MKRKNTFWRNLQAFIIRHERIKQQLLMRGIYFPRINIFSEL